MDRERLKGNLDLLLLSVLSAGPAHGYAIISALRDGLTGEGAAALAAEQNDWRKFASGVQAVLGWPAVSRPRRVAAALGWSS